MLKTAAILFRCSSEVKTSLETIARERDESISVIIREALREYFGSASRDTDDTLAGPAAVYPKPRHRPRGNSFNEGK